MTHAIPLSKRSLANVTQANDTPYTVYDLSSGSLLVDVNHIPLGTSIASRVGNSLRLYHCRYSFTLRPRVSTQGAGLGESLRVLLVYDNQPDPSTLLSSLLTEPNAHAPFRLENRDRFIVLSDIMYTLDAYSNDSGLVGNVSLYNYTKTIYEEVPIHEHSQYNQLSQPATGSVTLVWVTEGSSTNLEVAGTVRLEYCSVSMNAPPSKRKVNFVR